MNDDSALVEPELTDEIELSRAKLVLADGTEMLGRRFGGDLAVAGEVVFNTGMTGYVETLTDPSYKGQILVMTYPLVGNYGVPAPREAASLARPYESDAIQVQGLVVQNYVDEFSHYDAVRTLDEWLRADGDPRAGWHRYSYLDAAST